VAVEADLKQHLTAFAQGYPPVPIELSGYGAFAPRVIYIHTVQTPALMALQLALMTHWSDLCDLRDTVVSTHPFTRHLTVSFRDLTPAAFHSAWNEFGPRPWAAEFTATTLTLLRHDGSRWQVSYEAPLNAAA
jgi:2'-5' RNA ligase